MQNQLCATAKVVGMMVSVYLLVLVKLLVCEVTALTAEKAPKLGDNN
jgi:hypothetical protein